MANAAVDQSNIGPQDGAESALLLPLDPDASAERLRQDLRTRTQLSLGVVINDSFGRPWRRGTVGVAIGCAGIPALIDKRGDQDLFGRTLRSTIIALADEIAAAASMLPMAAMRPPRIPTSRIAAPSWFTTVPPLSTRSKVSAIAPLRLASGV